MLCCQQLTGTKAKHDKILQRSMHLYSTAEASLRHDELKA